MSIDKSLRRKNQLARSRNVLTRAERIKVLQDEERWPEGRSPYGLPKVRVLKVASKKAKKAMTSLKITSSGADRARTEGSGYFAVTHIAQRSKTLRIRIPGRRKPRGLVLQTKGLHVSNAFRGLAL